MGHGPRLGGALRGREGPGALRTGGSLRLLGHERELDHAFGTLGPAKRSLCGEGWDLRELSRPDPTHRPRLSAVRGFARGLAHTLGIGREAGPASRLAVAGEDFPRACPGVGVFRRIKLRNDWGARGRRGGEARAWGGPAMIEVLAIKLVL